MGLYIYDSDSFRGQLIHLKTNACHTKKKKSMMMIILQKRKWTVQVKGLRVASAGVVEGGVRPRGMVGVGVGGVPP